MNEQKHTPGPWKIANLYPLPDFGETYQITAHGVPTVARVNTDYAGMGLGEGEANARLIAAAPDMLAALKNIVELQADHGRLNLPECAAIARTAIQKAVG